LFEDNLREPWRASFLTGEGGAAFAWDGTEELPLGILDFFTTLDLEMASAETSLDRTSFLASETTTAFLDFVDGANVRVEGDFAWNSFLDGGG
jgi:hypothetical protein